LDQARKRIPALILNLHPIPETRHRPTPKLGYLLFFCVLSRLELSTTQTYAPQIRARLGTAAHLCEVVVLKLIAFGYPHRVSIDTSPCIVRESCCHISASERRGNTFKNNFYMKATARICVHENHGHNSASERKRNDLKGCNDFFSWSQGHRLALTVLCVPHSP